MASPENFPESLEKQFENLFQKNLSEFLENSEEDFPKEAKELIDTLASFHIELTTIANLEQAIQTRDEEINILRIALKDRPEELAQRIEDIEAETKDIQSEIRQHQNQAEKISDKINFDIDTLSFGNEDIKTKLESFLDRAKDIADMTRRAIH